MVHRAPDSRLLANLINYEKDYAKHLVALFPLSHTALASLSAYAAASPGPLSSDPDTASSPAQVITAVVNVLTAADDALHRYTHSLEAWREQLVSLKDLEDDLGAVLRDRDILVTRLIKASKASRDAHRASKLVPPLASLGSTSFSSLPSTNTSYTTTTASGATSTSTKLAQARAELQACEAHLVTKERELDARRISVAREGLGARCRALIDCGWVWGEVGKQGLRALQALSANLNGTAPAVPPKTVRTSVSASAIPSHFGLGPATYTSDNSSLTPSQSASQTAGPTTQESQTSKEYVPKTELPTQRHTIPTGDADLPPAHPISDLALPIGVRSQTPQNGDSVPNAKLAPVLAPAPAPRRRRTARARRPPSQHIPEVSDEGSDKRSSNEHNTNPIANISPHVRAPFPTSAGSHDTSSEDEAAIGPFEVVENDPFDVIRRSIIGPSPSLALIPTVPSASSPASASVPDVRTPRETSPSRAAMFPIQNATSANPLGHGHSLTPPSGKRERRTSMAFFGSLRGLFRKPKERDRVVTEWDHRHASPNASAINLGGKGWVTRTDARIRGGEDSEDDPVPIQANQTSRVNLIGVGRQPSGGRLRKGRPGAPRAASENAQHAASMDGWITDHPSGANGDAATSPARSRIRRPTMKRRKISVADLRGSEQGHTDGEVEGRMSLERVPSSKGIAKVPEGFVSATASKHKLDVAPVLGPRQGSNANANTGPGIQRSTTTIAISGHKPPDGKATHRRSASLSLVHTHVSSASLSSLNQGTRTPSSGSTNGSMSWRKPPPQLSPPPLPTESRSRSPSPPRAPQPTRRPAGNGHAHTPSLMSIVADVVTHQHDGEGRDREWDKARSMDVPRAPGSVLREAEANDRGARRASLTMVGESMQAKGQGQQRVVKMPLRSALRNPSRTPSPVSVAGVVSGTSAGLAPAADGRVVSPLSLRDSASVSSYETGRESFDGDERGVVLPPRSRSQSPVARPQSPPPRSQSPPARLTHTPPVPPPSFSFPPPPVDPPPVRDEIHRFSIGTVHPDVPSKPSAHVNGDAPSSSVSTETPPVTRRKSVRVSLQPTFSPTPPALCDEDGEAYAPWTESFSMRVQDERGRARARLEGRKERENMWVDSSDEDEVYSRARRLLSKGKGRKA